MIEKSADENYKVDFNKGRIVKKRQTKSHSPKQLESIEEEN